MFNNKYNIEVDYARDSLFDELGIRRLKDSYMRENEVSPQERFAFVCSAFASNQEHAQRMYEYASNHWVSFSTPILSFGRTRKGLPISCFLSQLVDTAEGLVDTMSEVASLSMMGGGVGVGVRIRSEDDKSVGVMPHIVTHEKISLAYRQGSTRRGSFAEYLDIGHPNIVQFIEMRKPTGDQNIRAMEIHHAVNIPDSFMEIIERCLKDDTADDTWELKDPGSDIVKKTISAKWLWEQLNEIRMRTGEPYIHFIDASNRAMPAYQKAMGLDVTMSNLCTEITLPTNEERTAVCCLLSVNLEYYDQFKNNYQFFKDSLEFLDNVLDYFIINAPPAAKKAAYSASRERSVGVGALGFHALLQSKMIPFESAMATSLNLQIFKTIKSNLDKATYELALERGPCPDAELAGVMVRNACRMAVAPNASSSTIMQNTSPSIEPYRANAYRQDTLSGSYMNKNRFLKKLLEQKATENPKLDLEEIWHGIISSAGSVQHLDFLSEYEKEVFKTASEIDQRWIIEHASERQEFIDQSQSVNLFFKATVDIPYLSHIHFLAWKKGLKTLYYCRSDKLYYGDKVNNKIARVRIEDTFEFDKTLEDTCLACE